MTDTSEDEDYFRHNIRGNVLFYFLHTDFSASALYD